MASSRLSREDIDQLWARQRVCLKTEQEVFRIIDDILVSYKNQTWVELYPILGYLTPPTGHPIVTLLRRKLIGSVLCYLQHRLDV